VGSKLNEYEIEIAKMNCYVLVLKAFLWAKHFLENLKEKLLIFQKAPLQY
jgi:hypothetical protein